MVLIFGGAYQGKLQYAHDNYTQNGSVHVCDEDCTEIDFDKEIIHRFHMLALANVKNGIDTVEFIENNMDSLKEKIIICDDICCGVVPMTVELRAWREAVGRSLALLSKKSDEVVRVFCGLPHYLVKR